MSTAWWLAQTGKEESRWSAATSCFPAVGTEHLVALVTIPAIGARQGEYGRSALHRDRRSGVASGSGLAIDASQ